MRGRERTLRIDIHGVTPEPRSDSSALSSLWGAQVKCLSLLESQISEYLQGFKEKSPPKPAACEVCKHADCLQWYGTYVRSLIALAKTYSVPIRRLYCTACHHTFALLPSFIRKFHRYAAEVIVTAMRWIKSHTFEKVAEVLTNRFMARQGRNVAPLTLYFWRRKFA